MSIRRRLADAITIARYLAARAARRIRSWIRRLLDPELGARLRAVIRLLSAIGALGAWAADEATVAAIIGGLQGVLALLVLTPTKTPDPSPSPSDPTDPPAG